MADTNKKIPEDCSGKEIKDMYLKGEALLDELSAEQLYKLADFEIEQLQTGGGDMELIDKCSSLINAKSTEHFSDAEIKSALENAFEKHESDDGAEKGVKRLSFRRLAVIFAAALLAAAVTVTAASAGFSGQNDDYFSMGQSILDSVAFGHSTFYQIKSAAKKLGDMFASGKDTRHFASVDEMKRETGLKFLSPESWPGGAETKSVTLSKNEYGEEVLEIETSNPDISFSVIFKMDASRMLVCQPGEVCNNGDAQFWLYEKYDGCYANACYDGNYYTIHTGSTDDSPYSYRDRFTVSADSRDDITIVDGFGEPPYYDSDSYTAPAEGFEALRYIVDNLQFYERQ